MALKIRLRVIIYFLLVSLSATYLKFESIYLLCFRNDLTANLLLLKLNTATIKQFFAEGSSDPLSVAKIKLSCWIKGKIGKELQSYNTVI
jgi:hypothetical protein